MAPLLYLPARLPIYAMLIAAFIPARRYLGGLLNLQGLTLAGLYCWGFSRGGDCRHYLQADAVPAARRLRS